MPNHPRFPSEGQASHVSIPVRGTALHLPKSAAKAFRRQARPSLNRSTDRDQDLGAFPEPIHARPGGVKHQVTLDGFQDLILAARIWIWPNASEMSGFRWGLGRCVVVTVGERAGSPVCVVLRGLGGTAIGAGAVHEARLGWNVSLDCCVLDGADVAPAAADAPVGMTSEVRSRARLGGCWRRRRGGPASGTGHARGDPPAGSNHKGQYRPSWRQRHAGGRMGVAGAC
jgi:hypothetical protein